MSTNAAFVILAAGGAVPVSFTGTSTTAVAVPSTQGKIALYADQECFVNFGPAAVAAASATLGWPIPAKQWIVFDGTPAGAYYRVISNGTSGSLWVAAAA